MANPVNITIDSAPASDGWGFVGRVLIGDLEVYRTIRAHTTPSEALVATSRLLSGVLGPLLAGQEWTEATEELQHAPLRSELGFGLSATHAEPGRSGWPAHDGTGHDTDGGP